LNIDAGLYFLVNVPLCYLLAARSSCGFTESSHRLKKQTKTRNITMCLATFLSELLSERKIDVRRLRIVQDNAKLEEETRQVITPHQEEKRCRWSLDGKIQTPRHDSDPCLTKPLRRGGRATCSESSFLGLPPQRKLGRRRYRSSTSHKSTLDDSFDGFLQKTASYKKQNEERATKGVSVPLTHHGTMFRFLLLEQEEK
jgi:hypothetical protein